MPRKPILGPNAKRWLKSTHLTLSVIWLGGAICMNVLRFAWIPVTGTDLYAVDHTIVLLDHWVVIPAAFGSLITGLFESWLTSWGFFKFRWVTVKWILTIVIMVYAPAFQARWAAQLEAISRSDGLLALQNPVYLQYRLLYMLSGVFLISTLTMLSVISTLKPWVIQDKQKPKNNLRHAAISE